MRVFAHRAAYDILKGSVPANMCVCHTCDNPSCCNPDHLFLGTHADNRADQKAKGRTMVGSKHHGSKLTEADVKKIRSLHGQYPHTEIAKQYGVSDRTINVIVSRKRWKHVA